MKSSYRSTTGGDKSSPHRVSDSELDFMRGGFGFGIAPTNPPPPPPPFPYSIKRTPHPQSIVESSDLKANNDDSHVHRLVIRHLEEDDILRIMPEIVREFGSLAQPPTKKIQESPGDEVATQIENFLFSFTVLFGLTQRVARRKKGYSSTDRECPDHNVICLVEQRIRRYDSGNKKNSIDGIGEITGTNYVEEGNASSYIEEEVVGIAELSWQPPNPNRNAPPYVLPYLMKVLFSRFFSPQRSSGGGGDTTTIGPKGYISNVLVWKNRRGRGYSHLLMAALEGIAKLWGCTDLRLHVDANEKSGSIAQQLYRSLGYVGVPDRGTTKSNRVGYEWMGPSMAHEGLYVVDGVPLLYLRKCL
jgi:GNAT superfamily N-acetyltransferase